MDTLELPPSRTLRRLETGLRIALTTGTGEGPTSLAAFDAALRDAGVANYNLICLSSVIPPAARIERRKYVTPSCDHGRRLYVVISQMRVARPGAQGFAGIGWVQEAATGRGLFVELHDESRERLEHDLHATLASMQEGRNQIFGPVHTEIAGVTCRDRPACALVIAVYKCEPW